MKPNWKTYRKSSCSLIIIDSLIDRKIGIGDLVTQEIRAVMVVVVLAQNVIVFDDKIIFVSILLISQIGYPTRLQEN